MALVMHLLYKSEIATLVDFCGYYGPYFSEGFRKQNVYGVKK